MRKFIVALALLTTGCVQTGTTTESTSDSTDAAAATSSPASSGFFVIEEMTDTNEDGTVYTFPVLSSPSDETLAGRINEILQNGELELIVGFQDTSIFENIWPKDGMGGTTEFGYRVIVNNERVFSIEFIKEGCGAYCEGYSTFYSFESQTGNVIEYLTLFTEDGVQMVQESIIDDRVKMLNDAIATATKAEDEDTKDMYTQCLEMMTAPDGGFGEFYIDKTSVHFIRGRCSNHAMQALDEIGDFDNVKTYEELQPYLNETGKGLLK